MLLQLADLVVRLHSIDNSRGQETTDFYTISRSLMEGGSNFPEYLNLRGS
jgi:hypothetical protein